MITKIKQHKLDNLNKSECLNLLQHIIKIANDTNTVISSAIKQHEKDTELNIKRKE